MVIFAAKDEVPFFGCHKKGLPGQTSLKQ